MYEILKKLKDMRRDAYHKMSNTPVTNFPDYDLACDKHKKAEAAYEAVFQLYRLTLEEI